MLWFETTILYRFLRNQCLESSFQIKSSSQEGRARHSQTHASRNQSKFYSFGLDRVQQSYLSMHARNGQKNEESSREAWGHGGHGGPKNNRNGQPARRPVSTYEPDCRFDILYLLDCRRTCSDAREQWELLVVKLEGSSRLLLICFCFFLFCRHRSLYIGKIIWIRFCDRT